MATSSADPAKLHGYSKGGSDLLDQLGPKAEAVDRSVRALSSSGYPGTLGDAHVRLLDLVGDWRHLDEFVGDVGEGFRSAGGGRGGAGGSGGSGGPGPIGRGLVTVDDNRLYEAARIGFADRDQAIAAGRRAAAELARLRQAMREAGGTKVDPQAVQNLVTMIRAGQDDPAFAVAFSKGAKAGGYADAAALVRQAYQRNGMVTPEGIAAAKVLSRTLTTALDTLPDVPAGQHKDPDNAHLPPDQRLGRDFTSDLTSGFAPDPRRPPGDVASRDLSVVLRFADPPTSVAVAIANSRMRRVVTRHAPNGLYTERGVVANAWGAHGNPVDNYATMLGRNRDAAATWLGDAKNMRFVLGHPGNGSDGGQALANLVRTGVTHPDKRRREQAMNLAIDDVGRYRTPFNRHMYGALAAGVEANMPLIDYRVNGIGWHPVGGQPPGASGEQPGTAGSAGLGQRPMEQRGRPELANTGIFLSQLMADRAASSRVRAATLGYVQGEGARAPTDERSLGRLLQITTLAEINAITEDYQAGRDIRDRVAKLVDMGIGAAAKGHAGIAYDGIGVVSGKSPAEWGAWLAGARDEAEFKRRLRDLREGRVQSDIGNLPFGGVAAEAGAFEVEKNIGADGRWQPYTPDEND